MRDMEYAFPRTYIRPGYSVSRVFKGNWQLSEGHLRQGSIDRNTALADMRRFVEAGITTFDMADIYTGTEEMVGDFLRQNQSAFQSDTLPPVQIHTKYVPDRNSLASLTEQDTRRIIERSLKRLGIEQLDLVQFHWWDYDVPRYVETAGHLQKLQREGKIRFIGVTNFDAQHLKEIIDAGVEVVSAQVQYSVLDRRPEKGFVNFCQEYDIGLFCYGTVAGGFLSNRYLDTPPPEISLEDLENRSLPKYRLIIDEIGGWGAYQRILKTLSAIAARHGVSASEIAIAYTLSRPAVISTIVGAHNASHIDGLQKIGDICLSADDISSISCVLQSCGTVPGDIYELERTDSRHSGIMKMNLNTQPH